MSSDDRGTNEAQLGFWRKAAFLLMGIIMAGVAGWFVFLGNQVQDNRESINGLHVEIASLRELVMVNTQAQRDTTTQLAALTGQLELLVRLDTPQVQGRQE